MSGEAERISVSREALRAELAELELRLTEKLASRDSLDAVEARVMLRVGELDQDVQAIAARILSESRVRELAREEVGSEKDEGRSLWQWVMGIALVLVSVSTFVLNVVNAGQG